MNGAMVLSDTSIRNMDFSQLSQVIKPKVDGSLYLDRIFWEVDLDFWVLVSSINCVIGNLGQANYAAANTFMCSLAAQRRKRGFRAATVNAGAIIGAGYMQRDRRALDHIVERLHMMRLSEEDWCQAISEAIEASRLESPHGPEITTGLADVPHDVSSPPYWFSNPKFASFILPEKAVTDRKDPETASVSILELLQKSQSQQDATKAVQGAFSAQLRQILQVTTSDEDLMAARSSEIGLDSLVSVDIRSWFLKNLRISIPVLKIMANDTMSALVFYVVENLDPELVPQLSGISATGEDSTESSPTSPTNTVSPTDRMYSAITTPSEPTDSANGFKREGAAYVNGNIDWNVESRPPGDYGSIEGHESLRSTNIPPRVIVLTGAGGLLGHHLLERLLARPGVEKVICLAIRQLSSRLEKNELPQHPRAVYHEGNLSQPLLGLSPEKANSVFEEADVVIHNGADTSHLKFYADLRVANVGSTVELTRLCLPRRTPIHYVSSVGVAMLYHHRECFPPVSVTDPKSSLPAPDGTFGYMCSKWVNERFLEHVHEQYGLPVYIHRPSTIVREGQDARTAKAKLDWVNALLHSVREIRAVPRIEHNRGALDLVYVDSACADVLEHVFNASMDDVVTYVHEVGDIVIPLHQLQDIDKEKGLTFEILPLDQWITRAIASGLHPAVAALIEAMDAPDAAPYPRLLKTLPEQQ